MISTHANCGLAPTQPSAIPTPKLLLATRRDYRNDFSIFKDPNIVMVNNGNEALASLHSLNPVGVILDTDLQYQSGWLVTAKIQFMRIQPRVVLLSDTRSDKVRAFAHFVGAHELRSRPQSGEQFMRLAYETMAGSS